MKIPLYQIDAFTSRVFGGNPAAVCPLEKWLEDGLMQAIAMENNLSETAFFVPLDQGYHIRWFTPASEVDLCGHATLASAFVLFTYLDPTMTDVSFRSRSGLLTVSRQGDLLSMDFPSQPPAPCRAPAKMVEALGKKPSKVLRSQDYFVLFPIDVTGRARTPLERVILEPVVGPEAEIDLSVHRWLEADARQQAVHGQGRELAPARAQLERGADIRSKPQVSPTAVPTCQPL